MDTQKIVEVAPYHPGYQGAVYRDSIGRPLSQVIREQMKSEGKRFWAGDNV